MDFRVSIFSGFMLAAVLCVALVSCEQTDDERDTYRPYRHRYFPTEPRLIRLKQIMDTLKNPQPKIEFRVDSTWWYKAGDSSEHLMAATLVKGSEVIHLPHRVQLPDRALWYSRQVSIAEPGYLRIRADDGAQLFVDGKQVVRNDGVYFPVAPSEKIDITVRVLNNAMGGGLREVAFISAKEFELYKKCRVQFLRVRRLIEKALLLRNISEKQITAVERLCENIGDHGLVNAESLFADQPYLVGPWITRVDDHNFKLSLLADSTRPVTLHYGYDSLKLDLMKEEQGHAITFLLEQVNSAKVFYQLTSGKTRSPLYYFNTVNDDKFSFHVWGDSQSGWEAFARNVQNVSPSDAFGIGAGDLVNNGSDEEEWRMFFNVLSSTSPYRVNYLVAGNHDHDGYYDDLIPVFYRQFTHYTPADYFSWKYGNCAFIALNPNLNFPIGVSKGSAQHHWFIQQLESDQWRNATWRFIIFHQTVYSQGWADYHGDEVLRDLIEPLAESAGVDFVISGHTHDYERLTKKYGKQRTTYLITGGGGGSLEPPESSSYPKMDTLIKSHHMVRFSVDRNRLVLKAIAVEGHVMDSLIFHK